MSGTTSTTFTAETAADRLTRHRSGDGEPLVLLHGLGLTWRCWKPVLAPLERHHDVLALDLPGFGTAQPLTAAPSIRALADAVEEELNRAGLRRVHVAGNSLGGWIALELARRGRAMSAVALAPAGLETPAERAGVIAMNELMRLRAVLAAPAAELLTRSPSVRTALLGPLHGRPWRVPARDAAAEVRDFARAPGFQRTLRCTIGSEAASGLDDIRVPVRICTGTRDAMLGVVTGPRFVVAIPGAELHPLIGCGHVPMADDPDAVAQAILDVTARTAGPAPT